MRHSVVIPSLERGTLWWVLDALLACDGYTPEDMQVVVCVSGVEAPSERCGEYPNVTWLHSKKRLGAGAARNRCLEVCTGDYITFLGDDTAPDKTWLTELQNALRTHPNAAVVGRVDWVPELASDPFHQWLLTGPQFLFPSKKTQVSWRHFYTSNITVPRAFLGEERFDETFNGWGFEDAELGYRLQKKGMRTWFFPSVRVTHDHPQTLMGVLKNTANAHKNAKYFEKKHPEVRVRPRGGRRVALWGAVLLGRSVPLTKWVSWWWRWKWTWLTGNLP